MTLLTLLLAACTPEAPPAPATPPKSSLPIPKAIKVGLNWYPEPEFGGFYTAVLDGTYYKNGLEVTLLPGGPGVPVLEMLQSGQIDVAISSADELLTRRAKGLDAVAVYPGFQDSPAGLLVHAGGAKSYAELSGTVAIETGSAFQRYIFKKFSLEGKVTQVPTTGSLGLFAADPTLSQQAFITSEPCVAEGQGLKVEFLPARDAGWNPYASLAVVRGKEVAEPWVAAFRKASKEGWDRYLADPTRANAEISKLNPNMPPAQMGCIVERQRSYVTGTDGVGVMTEARWNDIAAALSSIQESSIGEPVSAAGAWVP